MHHWVIFAIHCVASCCIAADRPSLKRGVISQDEEPAKKRATKVYSRTNRTSTSTSTTLGKSAVLQVEPAAVVPSATANIDTTDRVKAATLPDEVIVVCYQLLDSWDERK